MHNLLPQKNIGLLKKEYALRVMVVMAVFLFALGVVASADLFPAYLAAVGQEQAASAQEAKIAAASATASTSSVLGALQRSANEVALAQSLQTADMHDLLAEIVSYRTPGIIFSGISIGPLAGKTRPISLTGVAATREALVAFSQALQANASLSGANVPVSDFSKDSDIGFSLNVNLQVQ